ncbi:MAG: hypothetical protein NVS9B5_19730 [Terriglobales bacterium]
MPRMIDLIRASAVPSNLMQSAARGALSLPGDEMLEILVYLATENKIFGEQASLTLAGWDDKICKAAAFDPRTPTSVLAYLADPRNFRPVLLPALLQNPSVSDESLAKLANSVSRDLVDTFLSSHRVFRSSAILSALNSNPHTSGIQAAKISEAIKSPIVDSKPKAVAEPAEEVAPEAATAPAQIIPEMQASGAASAVNPTQPLAADAIAESPADTIGDLELAAYLAEHAAEISSEAGKPFQPLGGTHDEFSTKSDGGNEAAADSNAVTPVPQAAAHEAKAAPKKPPEQRGSALQKIARLDVTGRIQLAMKGNKEERSLLVRDGTKIVALAVLDSPKISDGEVEKFASQKNVLESVLRAIPMKRRFMKNYIVVKNLVFNPRTPMDVSLGLVKNLLLGDLKVLAGTKEVSETVRKLAMRMVSQKMEKK